MKAISQVLGQVAHKDWKVRTWRYTTASAGMRRLGARRLNCKQVGRDSRIWFQLHLISQDVYFWHFKKNSQGTAAPWDHTSVMWPFGGSGARKEPAHLASAVYKEEGLGTLIFLCKWCDYTKNILYCWHWTVLQMEQFCRVWKFDFWGQMAEVEKKE